MSNQLRQSPEERLEEYLQRCAEAHYEEKGESERLKDLGHQPGQTVISNVDPSILRKMLEDLKDESD